MDAGESLVTLFHLGPAHVLCSEAYSDWARGLVGVSRHMLVGGGREKETYTHFPGYGRQCADLHHAEVNLVYAVPAHVPVPKIGCSSCSIAHDHFLVLQTMAGLPCVLLRLARKCAPWLHSTAQQHPEPPYNPPIAVSLTHSF